MEDFMNIDNRVSKERIKKALPPKTIIMVLAIVAIISTIFYITIQNRTKKEILIWYVTTDSKNIFSENILESVNEYGTHNGFDRILLTRRHPKDGYFDVLMSTSGYYTCDIFIMKEDVILKYIDMDIFLPLSTDFNNGKELLYVEDDAIGVPIYDEYYLLINKKTDVDLETIYDIFDILSENK